jgi:hypothetical protein
MFHSSSNVVELPQDGSAGDRRGDTRLTTVKPPRPPIPVEGLWSLQQAAILIPISYGALRTLLWRYPNLAEKRYARGANFRWNRYLSDSEIRRIRRYRFRWLFPPLSPRCHTNERQEICPTCGRRYTRTPEDASTAPPSGAGGATEREQGWGQPAPRPGGKADGAKIAGRPERPPESAPGDEGRGGELPLAAEGRNCNRDRARESRVL